MRTRLNRNGSKIAKMPKKRPGPSRPSRIIPSSNLRGRLTRSVGPLPGLNAFRGLNASPGLNRGQATIVKTLRYAYPGLGDIAPPSLKALKAVRNQKAKIARQNYEFYSQKDHPIQKSKHRKVVLNRLKRKASFKPTLRDLVKAQNPSKTFVDARAASDEELYR